ncbi:hypothetical protein ES703_121218 [subsurface metagenome]|jgi:DNA-binding NarL/FixJ family response regulator
MLGEMASTIRVLIVDDHRLFRDGLCELLVKEPDIRVVGTAEKGESVIRSACDLSGRTTALSSLRKQFVTG